MCNHAECRLWADGGTEHTTISITPTFEARKAKPKKKTQRIVCDFCFPRILVGPMCVSHIYDMRGPLRYVKKSKRWHDAVAYLGGGGGGGGGGLGG